MLTYVCAVFFFNISKMKWMKSKSICKFLLNLVIYLYLFRNWDQYKPLYSSFLRQNYNPSMLCVYGADLSAYICMCAVCRANVWRGGGVASIAVAAAHTAYASNRAKADYYM